MTDGEAMLIQILTAKELGIDSGYSVFAKRGLEKGVFPIYITIYIEKSAEEAVKKINKLGLVEQAQSVAEKIMKKYGVEA